MHSQAQRSTKPEASESEVTVMSDGDGLPGSGCLCRGTESPNANADNLRVNSIQCSGSSRVRESSNRTLVLRMKCLSRASTMSQLAFYQSPVDNLSLQH